MGWSKARAFSGEVGPGSRREKRVKSRIWSIRYRSIETKDPRFKMRPTGSKSAIFAPAPLQCRGLRPGRIGSGQTAHPGPGIEGTAPDRIGKDRRQQRRFARRQRQGRMAEGIDRAGLGAELA